MPAVTVAREIGTAVVAIVLALVVFAAFIMAVGVTGSIVIGTVQGLLDRHRDRKARDASGA